MKYLNIQRTWIDNESWIIFITYYTQTNQKDGYGNPLNSIVFFCLSPSPSPPTTFIQNIRPNMLTTSNLEAVGTLWNYRESIVNNVIYKIFLDRNRKHISNPIDETYVDNDKQNISGTR